MSMTEWAEHEVERACKKENPDWDGKSFDYGCACYQSALKAYKSLMEDEHSGASFSITRTILERLMRNLPLTSITEEDFRDAANLMSDEYLTEHGMVSQQQCPRMSSLFKTVYTDGTVCYNDINRVVCLAVNETDPIGYSCGFINNIINERFPLKLPYWPAKRPYKVYTEELLVDPKNGDYDTVGVFYVVDPEGVRHEINKFFTEKDGKLGEISKEEYDALHDKALMHGA